MPPALSDEEVNSGSSGDEERIPAAKTLPVRQNDIADGDEEVDEEPDEYIVEEILSHKTIKGVVKYDVKWFGYDDPGDRTWEPEDNLEGARDVLEEYWANIGGRPNPKAAAGQKRKGRKSLIDTEDQVVVNKRMKQEVEWAPPIGSWEDEVEEVETVEQVRDPKTDDVSLYAYVKWNNKRQTQHPVTIVNRKCPQKIIQYYESHLVFTEDKVEDVSA